MLPGPELAKLLLSRSPAIFRAHQVLSMIVLGEKFNANWSVSLSKMLSKLSYWSASRFSASASLSPSTIIDGIGKP